MRPWDEKEWQSRSALEERAACARPPPLSACPAAACRSAGICHTNIGDHIGGRATCFYCLYKPWLKSAAQGAATTVYAATAPELRGRNGAYLEDCAETKRAQGGEGLRQAQMLPAHQPCSCPSSPVTLLKCCPPCRCSLAPGAGRRHGAQAVGEERAPDWRGTEEGRAGLRHTDASCRPGAAAQQQANATAHLAVGTTA